MAVAVEMRFAGATLEQYDEVVSLMGFSPEGRGANGGLFHWVTQTADGIRVVDVWDTPEQFESFSEADDSPARGAGRDQHRARAELLPGAQLLHGGVGADRAVGV